jgi:hypothetical protein
LTNHDARDISALLAERIRELAPALLPKGREQGDLFNAGNLDGQDRPRLLIGLSGPHQGRWRDFATGEGGDALELVERARNCDTRQALAWARQWLDLDRAEALAVWGAARDPRHTPVDTYLSRLGLVLTGALADHVIGYHPACPWRVESGETISVRAMVVAMRSIDTDEITAVQVTRLSPEAEKIGRRMLGLAGGAAVKLDRDESVTDRLVVGEGVENCIAAQQMGLQPVWALCSAGVEQFPVVAGVERLAILAENDERSPPAVAACAARWHAAGRKVFEVRPKVGKDMNDALMAADRRERLSSLRRRR